jgi:hypothetical protein
VEEIQRRKMRQRMQNCSDKQFWDYMNAIHYGAYQSGQKHLMEAMSCHPRISKRMVTEVEEKALKIRTEWDGMSERVIEVSIDHLTGLPAICPHCGKSTNMG